MTNNSYGEQPYRRTRRLLEAILNYDDQLCDELFFQRRWDENTNHLIVKTTVKDLKKLCENYNKHHEQLELSIAQVRESLNSMKNFLHILTDHRIKTQGSKIWHFTLTLWSRDINKNLENFDYKWNNKHPSKNREHIKNNQNLPDKTFSQSLDNKTTLDHSIALLQACRILKNLGDNELTYAVAESLLEHYLPEIFSNNALENEIKEYLDIPIINNIKKVQEHLIKQQPFYFTYTDSKNNTESFTILYAEIATHNRQRIYLDCWCEEVEGSQDIEDLQHNRTFNLKKISNFTIVPAEDKKWKSSGLDSICIEMIFTKGLISKALEIKDTNQNKYKSINQLSARQVQVIQPITNTFCFFQDILRYKEDCVIIQPDHVRQKFYEIIQKMNDLYKKED
jgi:predicted DNA-binding transcriptional regulator YafY